MNRQDGAARAFALQTTILVILLLFLVVLSASSFRAASPIKPGEQSGSIEQSGFYPPLPNSILSKGKVSQNAPEQAVAVTAPTFFMDTSDGFAINNQAVTVSNINPSLNYIGFQADLIFDSAVAVPTPGTAPVAATGLTNAGSPGWTVSGNIISTCNGSLCPGTLRTLRISAFSNDGVTPLSGAGVLYQIHWKRVSATFGQSTALTWGSTGTGNDFQFFDTALDSTSASPQNNGRITITATTPCSCGGANISGTITYCSHPNNPPIPGVTVTLANNYGGTSGQTDANGYYHLEYDGPTGPDQLGAAPSKANLPPGSAGITTVDVIATQRHFLGLAMLSGCRLTAADVNGDSSVTTVDVIAIQRFYLGISTGTANVGQHRFTPSGRSYPPNITLTNENYSALVFGDVASPFIYPLGPTPTPASTPNGPVIEAENAVLTGCYAQSDVQASSGFRVDGIDAVGDSAKFTQVPVGTHIMFWYATPNNGHMSLYVNDVFRTLVDFAPTAGGWVYPFVGKEVATDIPAGSSVKLQFDSGDRAINLDYIQIY